MSCWKQVKLETLHNVETEFFLEALDKMGYKADFNQKSIRRTTKTNSNKCRARRCCNITKGKNK